MKKNYLFICGLIITGSVFSQKTNTEQMVHKPFKIENELATFSTKGNDIISKAGGDVLYSETFATVGAWTTSGADGALWLRDTDGPNGQFSNATQKIASTTTTDGFMIFDADFSNAAAPYVNKVGSLVSPVYDISATPDVLIYFEQSYRTCCSRDFKPLLELTTDNFATIYTVDVTVPGFSVNNFTGTIKNKFNISEFTKTASNLNNFQFRFTFDGSVGTSHYFWQIDDVKVVEMHDYNLALTDTWLGDIVNDFEITESPKALAGNLIVQSALRQYGKNIPSNVALRLKVYNSSNVEVYNQAGGVLSNNFASIFDTITFTSTLDMSTLPIDSYRVDASIEFVQTDADLIDNLGMRTFKITANKMSSVNFESSLVRNSFGYAYGPRNAQNVITGSVDMQVGSIFKIPTDVELTGIDIALATGTMTFPSTVGEEITLNIWEYKPANPQDSRFEYVFGDYTYLTAANQFTTDGSSYFNFDFANSTGETQPFTLLGGTTYYVSFTHYGGSGVYQWYWTTQKDEDFSSWVHGPFGAGSAINWFTAGYDPLIKMSFDKLVSTEKIKQDAFDVSLVPNPATENVNIHYTLKDNSNVSVEVRDLSGKVVYTQKEVSQKSGYNKTAIATSAFGNGVYFVNLNVNGSIITKKLVVNN